MGDSAAIAWSGGKIWMEERAEQSEEQKERGLNSDHIGWQGSLGAANKRRGRSKSTGTKGGRLDGEKEQIERRRERGEKGQGVPKRELRQGVASQRQEVLVLGRENGKMCAALRRPGA